MLSTIVINKVSLKNIKYCPHECPAGISFRGDEE